MADSKLSDLTADASPGSDDILYMVADPSGTPVDRKVTLGNVAGSTPFTSAFAPIATVDDYVPAFTQSGALTLSSLFAQQTRLDDLVILQGRCTFSNAGTTNNPVRMTVPVSIHASLAANTGHVGSGMFTDNGTALYGVHFLAVNATTVDIYVNQLTAGTPLGQSPNMAVANADQLRWLIIYPAA